MKLQEPLSLLGDKYCVITCELDTSAPWYPDVQEWIWHAHERSCKSAQL